MIEAGLPVKTEKPLIAVHHIEADAELELAQTDRAEREWPGVALLQVI
jgi:tRNA A37 threonylcarbamoyltransferase TsaD